MPTWYMHIAMPGLLCLVALFIFGIGLRGLVTRRPFLMSARWLFGFMLLSFLPNLLLPLLASSRTGTEASASHVVLTWSGPAMFIVLAVSMSLVMRGYIAFGVTEASLRQGLFAALGQLELPHEETVGAVRLPTVPAELQVAVQSWVGTGQLKARKRAAAPLLATIARSMNQYFQTTTVPVNLTCSIVYAVLGAMVGAVGVAMFVVLP